MTCIHRAGPDRKTSISLLSSVCAVQILGNNECFEPYTSNIYVRRVLSGEFTVVNQHLLQDLTRLGLWNRDLKNELVHRDGSVQARRASPRCHCEGQHADCMSCSGSAVQCAADLLLVGQTSLAILT